MTLAVIDTSRPCMEKTLIPVIQFPIPEVAKRQKDMRKRCVSCDNLCVYPLS
jgi:hypothetical protein